MNEWKTVILGDVCGGSLPLAPTACGVFATPSAGDTPATPLYCHTDLFAANAAHGIMEK